MAEKLIPISKLSTDTFYSIPDSWLSILFSKSKSQNYNLALMIANASKYFSEIDINGAQINIVGFGEGEQEANRASELLKLVSKWKGTICFSKRRIVDNINAIPYVLSCYKMACKHSNHGHYCRKEIDDSPIGFPCKRLYNRLWKYDIKDTKTLIEVMRVEASTDCIHICPLFVDNFKIWYEANSEAPNDKTTDSNITLHCRTKRPEH
jgi:hypothetical protein